MSQKKGGWIRNRAKDPFLQKAHREDYRSRAVYKLKELDEKFQLLRPEFKLIADLGSAPGSWSQYCVRKFPNIPLFSCDLLDIEPIPGVDFHQIDIFSEEMPFLLDDVTLESPFDIILSDMAPSTSGVKDRDSFESHRLIHHSLSHLGPFLKFNGSALFKLFQGELTSPLREFWQSYFKNISLYQTLATPKGSKEVFLLFQNRCKTITPELGEKFESLE